MYLDVRKILLEKSAHLCPAYLSRGVYLLIYKIKLDVSLDVRSFVLHQDAHLDARKMSVRS